MANSSFENNTHPYGPTVGRLVDEFARLPGIGRKTAERLTQHILLCSEEDANALAVAIQNV
ncbi:MAG: recombination protein RecR, partial [Planctomycetaceae bacterium]